MNGFPPSVMMTMSGFDPASVGAEFGLADLDRVPVRRAPGWMVRAWGDRAAAMTLPWAIYVKPGVLAGDRQVLGGLVRHELVHVRQWHQLGVTRFLLRYFTDYVRGRRAGLGHQKAYLAISLEEEARRLSGH